MQMPEVESLPLDLGRLTRVHTLRMFEHYLHPEVPTDFD
jgi:hypothetical protein